MRYEFPLVGIGWLSIEPTQAIKLDPTNPDGYERKYAASRALQRYFEAADAFSRMFSLIENSSNPDVHRECLLTKMCENNDVDYIVQDCARNIFHLPEQKLSSTTPSAGSSGHAPSCSSTSRVALSATDQSEGIRSSRNNSSKNSYAP